MNIWLISDTHFGHANILTFKTEDGSPLRSFSSVEEMDEHMVERWNSVVKPADHVYHLGDVAMNPKCIPIVSRLNGHKRLVLGNHDHHVMKLYTPYFEKIFATRRLDNLLLSHYPVHPASISGKLIANVHGHVHKNEYDYGVKYFNVCVEMLDYTPIAFEDLKKRIAERQYFVYED